MIEALFEKILNQESDIRGHLKFLQGIAKGTVLELGVRGGNSTIAFLKGLEEKGGHLWSVDVVESCGEVAKGHPQWTFINGFSTEKQKILAAGISVPIDVLFLDTLHSFPQVSQELEVWGPEVNPQGVILIHDVITFPPADMAAHNYAFRNYYDYEVREGYNGLGVIRKVPVLIKPKGGHYV